MLLLRPASFASHEFDKAIAHIRPNIQIGDLLLILGSFAIQNRGECYVCFPLEHRDPFIDRSHPFVVSFQNYDVILCLLQGAVLLLLVNEIKRVTSSCWARGLATHRIGEEPAVRVSRPDGQLITRPGPLLSFLFLFFYFKIINKREIERATIAHSLGRPGRKQLWSGRAGRCSSASRLRAELFFLFFRFPFFLLLSGTPVIMSKLSVRSDSTRRRKRTRLCSIDCSCWMRFPAALLFVFLAIGTGSLVVLVVASSSGEFVDSGHLVWTTIGVTSRSKF